MSRRHAMFRALLAAGLLGASSVLGAAEIKLINLDLGTGKGLDNTAPVTPVGGNPATTYGGQAYNVFKFAADIWGAILQSDVPINNTITFQDLACTSTSATLGSSGTYYIFSFNNPPPSGAVANTWYHSALADALGGVDAAGAEGEPADTPDITSRFNGKIGQAGCLDGSGWYFGLDGQTPDNRTNFLNVVLHEMAHGLGFSGFNTLSTGAQLQGQQDIYSTFVLDNSTGKRWTAMSDAERKVAALNDNHLVFTGAEVKAEAPLALGRPTVLKVSAPAAVAGDYEYAQAAFGPAASATNFSGEVVQALSGTATDGCAALTNAAAIAGKVALIDRGSCDFTVKALNAQAAGASAVLLANNQAAGVTPGGTPASPVTIPVILVSQVDGNALKANLAGLAVNGVAQGSGLAGADSAGNVKLYAPAALVQGSSFSHYDTRLDPNAIMEYAITASLAGQIDVDLTPALLKDEGWKLNEGGQKLLDCNTGVPTWQPGGLIVGANLFASARLFAGTSASFDDYRAAILGYAAKLAGSGLIDAAQASSLNACLSTAELQKQFASWGNAGGGEPPEDVAITLDNGVALGGQSGTQGAEVIYQLAVPAGARSLNIRSFGGSGDVSLYVKAGAEPTRTSYDQASIHTGNSESVVIARPAAGTYLIKLIGVKAYSGVSVQATYVATP